MISRKFFTLSSVLALSLGVVSGCAGTSSKTMVSSDERGEITAGPETQVTTTYGPVEGYRDGTVYTFKGIPYAKAERFMEPQAPDPWTEVRQCKVYGPQAPQGENLRWNEASSQTDYTWGNNFVIEPMDEKNCFVLNVWTPGINDGKKRPVFVWCHGGGWAGGSGHDLPCYEGYSLAKKGDIVVVNFNHRLNDLGFLDLSCFGGKYANSVNLGLKDIVKVLEWVRDNIAKFGGDPSQVTIAGQSGGGGKVSTLLCMPAAKGLFQRAIVQSGSLFPIHEPEQGEAYARALVEALGLNAATIDKIQDCSYDEIVAAGQAADRKLAASAPKGVIRMPGASPVVDGKSIVQQPYDANSPEVSSDVPLMVGSNFHEFHYDVDKTVPEAEVMAKLTERMGKEKAEAFAAAFRKDFPDLGAYDMLYIDDQCRPAAVRHATAKSNKEGGAPVWLYYFNWRPESNALGASHGMELPFMFNNVALEREMTGASESAYALQDIVSDTWLSFIKTGNPNHAGLPEWAPYDTSSAVTMVFDKTCRAVSHLDDDVLHVY